MSKPRSTSTINPNYEQRMVRNEARLSLLPQLIKEAKTPEKKAGFQVEYERRVAELKADIAQKLETLSRIEK